MAGQLPTEPKSLCILRLSAIGDVCHAVAMVQQIQKQYPQTQITWVIGKVEHMLLSGLPGVEFIVFDKSKGWRGYRQLQQQMSGRRFDVLLHMQVALRASIASLFIPANVKIGFDKSRAKEGQWLFTNHQIDAQSEPHVLDGFLNFAKAIGVKTSEPSWLMPFGDEERQWTKQHISQDKLYCVIAAAASKAERNWHAKGYAEAADHMAKQGYNVVLCGGPAELEKQLARDIEALTECSPINLVGKTNLKQMLAVLESAKLVIAPDTGPAHMATAVNTPVIGLYAHSNPKRTGPYCDQNLVVSVYEQCIEQQHGKTSAQLPWGIRAKGNLMDNIHIDMVTDAIEKAL
ncbi:glycosyltransferase family 9 protein [Thalassotalea ponticola]|uniref:glycosyltransferase family 9 protein n=1 Tax=Thalassotalea ponticola TaxID=1523392 RepID=UPI0025B390AC|nr:glycosyltransferase family 9 protein [Thalassotalea ponticola]MDN3652796.1 glycosyltransferase family 9 protein [Thalassotalea ponticola]